jgi:hypothetical protein
MNCFNIREVQALLKGRFFSDLMNSNDTHQFLNNLVISVRYKTNNTNATNFNMLMFYQYGISNNATNRTGSYVLTNVVTETTNKFPENENLFFQGVNFLVNGHYTDNFRKLFTLYFTTDYITYGGPDTI